MNPYDDGYDEAAERLIAAHERLLAREEMRALADCNGLQGIDVDDYRASVGLPPCGCEEEGDHLDHIMANEPDYRPPWE